jgi:hypothetical protein
MNQKMMIYIILSTILLYLYYRKRDLSILMAFIVLVSSTLIFGNDVREGAKSGSGGRGGGCKDMGFTAPKVVKNDNGDIGESLEKEMKNIKTVADNYWPYDERGESKDEKENESMKEFIGIYFKEVKENKLSDEDSKNAEAFMALCKDLYNKVNNSDKSKRENLKLKTSDIPKGYLKTFVSGGNALVKVLENVGTKLENAGAKKLNKYLICLCKHWNAIFNLIDGMAGKKD